MSENTIEKHIIITSPSSLDPVSKLRNLIIVMFRTNTYVHGLKFKTNHYGLKHILLVIGLYSIFTRILVTVKDFDNLAFKILHLLYNNKTKIGFFSLFLKWTPLQFVLDLSTELP